MFRFHKRTIILIVVIACLLAACGSGNSDEPLPTRAALLTPVETVQAEITPEPAAEATAEITPEVTAGDVNPAEIPSQIPEITPEETPDLSSLETPSPIELNLPQLDVSALQAGDTVSFTGLLTLDDSAQIAIVTLDDGSQIALDVPAVLGQTLHDLRVEVRGVVTEPPAGVDLVFVQTDYIAHLPDAADAIAIPEAETTVEAVILPDIPGVERLSDARLEQQPTALEAYDFMVENLADALEGLVWVSLTGSDAAGWTVAFFKADEDLMRSYRVNVDGTLDSLPDAPAITLPGMEIMPLDRETITLDSSSVSEIIDLDTATLPLVTYYLAADEDGRALWSVITILDETLGVIDAATGERVDQ